ncbi:MAG: hypothetical protein RL529_570 [Actinomycetota bacterium]
MRGGAQTLRTILFKDVGQLLKNRARDATNIWGYTNEVLAVLLLVNADVVTNRSRSRSRRAIWQGVAEVFILENLAKLLDAPVGEQELQASLGAHATETIVYLG